MHHLFGDFLTRNFSGDIIPAVSYVESDRVAVIVETRCDYFLPKVIKNFVTTLDSKWNFHLFVTAEVATFLQERLPGLLCKVTIIGVEGKLTPQCYSKFLMSKQFWEAICEEHVLIFQLDTVLLNDVPDSFLSYDMIGAPCGPDMSVFNGGLSIRRRGAMLAALDAVELKAEEPEDVYFTRALREMNGRLPAVSDAIKFSTESVVPQDFKSCGVHGTDKYYLTDEVISKLLQNR